MKKNIKLYKFNEIDSTNEYLRKNHKSYEEFDVISTYELAILTNWVIGPKGYYP